MLFLAYDEILLNFLLEFLDVGSCRLLAAQAECQAECQRERDDQAREEGLDERRYAQLIECRENRKHPNRPAGDGSEQISRT